MLSQLQDSLTWLASAKARGLRFLIVGILNSSFSYAVYSMVVFIGIRPSIASILATGVGVIFNFGTSSRLVFREFKGNAYAFTLSYVASMTLSVVLLEILTWLHFNPYVAGLIVALPVAGLSYYLQRRFVFRGSR